MIKGRRVKVDDLSVEDRNALVGQRVAACYARHDDEGFDSWDIGTVLAKKPLDGTSLIVHFDSLNDSIGVFPEEYIIILTIED